MALAHDARAPYERAPLAAKTDAEEALSLPAPSPRETNTGGAERSGASVLPEEPVPRTAEGARFGEGASSLVLSPTTLARKAATARTVELGAWALFWFSLGAASMAHAAERPMGLWLLVATGAWAVGASAHRRAARWRERLSALARGDSGAGASRRAIESLSLAGDALRALASWADDATSFLHDDGPSEPPPVDPDAPIPPMPMPRDAALTAAPGKLASGVREREAEPPVKDGDSRPELPPPSVKLLEAGSVPPHAKRDADHDPETCEVCQAVYGPVTPKPDAR
jgi:hypothetical protein